MPKEAQEKMIEMFFPRGRLDKIRKALEKHDAN